MFSQLHNLYLVMSTCLFKLTSLYPNIPVCKTKTKLKATHLQYLFFLLRLPGYLPRGHFVPSRVGLPWLIADSIKIHLFCASYLQILSQYNINRSMSHISICIDTHITSCSLWKRLVRRHKLTDVVSMSGRLVWRYWCLVPSWTPV